MMKDNQTMRIALSGPLLSSIKNGQDWLKTVRNGWKMGENGKKKKNRDGEAQNQLTVVEDVW